MFCPEQRGNTAHFGELVAPSMKMDEASHEKKSPRPHQKEAVRDLVKALSASGSDVRAQGHMACGTGKTMVALWVAEAMQAERTLLAEPSLPLIAQNLKEWRENARGPTPEVLVVCSDQTVVRPNQDEVRVDLGDIPARVTNSPEEIAQFLKSKSARKILMSTYHSLPLLGKAMETRGTERFDIAIADEAHRTAAKEDGAFTIFHDPEAIRSKARLYLTATPKIYEGDSEVKISMDDESIFGKVAHSLPFSRAIELGLLTDYRLVVATLPENYAGKKGEPVSKEMRDAVAQLAVLRAIETYNLSKVVSFHNSVARAHAFAKSFEVTGAKYLKGRSIWAHGVDGTMPSRTRDDLLKLLSERPQNALSLISNCRCLTEGIDIPAIDGIVFFDPKRGEVDIVQAIGRAIRQSTSTNKDYGTIIVPLVVPENAESADFLDSTPYRYVAQIMRALRAHDDRFEVRTSDMLVEYASNQRGHRGSSESVIFNPEGLSTNLIERLSIKILKIGAGMRGSPLTEELIIRAAIQHFEKTGNWPTNNDSTSSIPLLPGDNWAAVSLALSRGYRGLESGKSLAKILGPTKKAFGSEIRTVGTPLTEQIIVEAAVEHFERTQKWPTQETVEDIPLLPGDNWTAINAAGYLGQRGLEKGRTLPRILAPIKAGYGTKIRNEGGALSEATIIEAAVQHFKKTGMWPSCNDRSSEIPLLPGSTWGTINSAGRQGNRGLGKGRLLTKILAPVKEHYRNNPDAR
jgi:superfamily II DNA or RNA helicase